MKQRKNEVIGDPKKYKNMVKVEYKYQPEGEYVLLRDYIVKSEAFGASRITGGSKYDSTSKRDKLAKTRSTAKHKYIAFYNIDSSQVIAKPVKGTIRYVKFIKRFDDNGKQIHYRDPKTKRFIKYTDVI